MAVVTHTSEGPYRLRKAVGKGPRLWAGCITVTNDETIDTGLDTIEGVGAIAVEATDIDANTNILCLKSITGGTITFTAAAIGAYGAATDMVAYLVAVGTARGM